MNVTIRAAKENDVPNTLPLAEKFWNITDYEEAFDPDRSLEVLYACLDHGIFSIAELDCRIVGFCCGVSGLLPCSTEAKCGMEIAWWLEPHVRGNGTGVALLEHTEQSARESGVKYWTMLSMECSSPEHAERLYLANGYKHSETSYIKVL